LLKVVGTYRPYAGVPDIGQPTLGRSELELDRPPCQGAGGEERVTVLPRQGEELIRRDAETSVDPREEVLDPPRRFEGGPRSKVSVANQRIPS